MTTGESSTIMVIALSYSFKNLAYALKKSENVNLTINLTIVTIWYELDGLMIDSFLVLEWCSNCYPLHTC